MLPRRYWQEMTAAEIRGADTSGWIAVLPVAAIEQHGPHLPVGTDTIIAEGQVRRVVELLAGATATPPAGAPGAPPAAPSGTGPDPLPVTFLPVQAVGKSNEHLAAPGTLTLSAEVAVRAWTEIGESVARAGVRKLVIVTAHGGNVSVVDIVARDLRVRLGMLAVQTAWSRFGQPEGVFAGRELAYGIHGGDVETSLVLHLAPGLVHMDRAEDFRSAQEGFVQEFSHLRGHGPHAFGWMAQDLNPAGVVGDAAAATAEKGFLSLDHAAKGFIALLRDVDRFDLARLRPEWGGEA
jgi:creatinine amidohydrolase